MGKHGTCTSANASVESLELAARTRRRKWDCWNAAGKFALQIIPNRKRKALHDEVEAGSTLYTDALLSYEGLASTYAHQIVDHAVEYVNGRIHTNGLENFWSLLKRGIGGTYVNVEPFHLFRYLDERMSSLFATTIVRRRIIG